MTFDFGTMSCNYAAIFIKLYMVSVSLFIIYAFIKQYACGAQSCEQSLHMQPQMYGCPCLYIGEGAYAVGATWPCNAFKAGYMDCCCC